MFIGSIQLPTKYWPQWSRASSNNPDLVGDYRPSRVYSQWPNHSHTTLITLARLTRRDGTKLVEQVAGGRAALPEVMDQIVARADGVPLFLKDSARLLKNNMLEERNRQYVLSKPIPMQAVGAGPARIPDGASGQIGVGQGNRPDWRGDRTRILYSLLRAVTAVDEAALNDALSRLKECRARILTQAPPEAIYSFGAPRSCRTSPTRAC